MGRRDRHNRECGGRGKQKYIRSGAIRRMRERSPGSGILQVGSQRRNLMLKQNTFF
jgi:hypothetical protein